MKNITELKVERMARAAYPLNPVIRGIMSYPDSGGTIVRHYNAAWEDLTPEEREPYLAMNRAALAALPAGSKEEIEVPNTGDQTENHYSMEELVPGSLAEWERMIFGEVRPDDEGCNDILFWKPIVYEGSKDNGFEFICLKWASGLGRKDGGFDDRYEIMLTGRATFDGMRHLYFGDPKTDNYGYFYYPDLPRILEVLTFLDELQVKLCWDLRACRKSKS